MSVKYQFAAFLLSSFMGACVANVAHAAAPHAQPKGLTVAVASAPRTLNPATTTDAAGARLLQLTHPALLRWSQNYQPEGLLAQGCSQPQPTRVECTLRSGQTFLDGAPLTATAVAAWYKTLQANPLSPFAQLKDVSVTAPTATQLVLQLPSPTLGFAGILTEIPIANPQNPAIGAGPYQFVAHDTLGAVTLATSRTDLPATLTFTPLSDATTRLIKLKKGEVDIVYNDVAPQLVDWAKHQGFAVQSVPGTSYSYLGLNLQHPQLKNPLVREAMALALNRAAIRKYVLGDMAEPASTLLPPGHPAAFNAPEEPFAPFDAENLLDEADLMRGPDNLRFRITLLTSTDPFSQRVSQVIQQQLEKVGIGVTLRPTEWASFYDTVKKGNFDMVMLAWTGELPPSFYHQAFHSTQVPPVGLNRGRLNDPQTDMLTHSILSAPTVQAQTVATLATQQYLAKVRPYLPLYRRHQILITKPTVTGCTVPPSGAYTGLLSCRTVAP
ncbi:MAG: ABC transporter substrate-binding protein [Blastochloris viridis]|uniref:ABC transporter substrate-binding protein n=1 Tax=Blastochloris viridis TaxID=1079 RepID=A0A6N4RAV7_BLAVI|nr:MAG: ABC transporter substrate-binding protein [Blastochloris viridis]